MVAGYRLRRCCRWPVAGYRLGQNCHPDESQDPPPQYFSSGYFVGATLAVAPDIRTITSAVALTICMATARVAPNKHKFHHKGEVGVGAADPDFRQDDSSGSTGNR